jgi:hypothetical protein
MSGSEAAEMPTKAMGVLQRESVIEAGRTAAVYE